MEHIRHSKREEERKKERRKRMQMKKGREYLMIINAEDLFPKSKSVLKRGGERKREGRETKRERERLKGREGRD